MESKTVIGSIVRGSNDELCIQHPDSKKGIRRDYRSDNLVGFSRVEVSYLDDGTYLYVRQPRPAPIEPAPLEVEVRTPPPTTDNQQIWREINYPDGGWNGCNPIWISTMGTSMLLGGVGIIMLRNEPIEDLIADPLVVTCFIATLVFYFLGKIRREQIEARKETIRNYIRDTFHAQAIERLDHILDSLIANYHTLALHLDEDRFEYARSLIGWVINDLSVDRINGITCIDAHHVIRSLLDENASLENIKQATKLFGTITNYYKRSEKPSPVFETLHSTAQLMIGLVEQMEKNPEFQPALRLAIELANILVQQKEGSQFIPLITPALTDAAVNLIVALDRVEAHILQQTALKLLKDINNEHFEKLFPKETKNESPQKTTTGDFFKTKRIKESLTDELRLPLLLNEDKHGGRLGDNKKKNEHRISINHG